jgi:polyisoprenoid-binding protein YceI
MAALAALLIATASAKANSTVTIDPRRTDIRFAVDAIGWPTTTGRFREFDGRLSINFETPARSSVRFTVRTGSVDAGGAAITQFVRSEAMLNAARFPEISFRSTRVERTGERTVRVTGDLDFYGTTRPAVFEVDVDRPARGQSLTFVARGTLSRAAFGFISGQPLISDEVRITVSTVGTVSD